MAMETLLIDTVVVMERFPGKGGWTYARIPGLLSNKGKPFGWGKAKVIIDDYEIPEVTIMSMGNGRGFIAIKAAIRKIIGKEAGHSVRIRMYPLETDFDHNAEFMICLKDEPAALEFFNSLNKVEQEKYLDWIGQASTPDQKIDRIAKSINKIAMGIKMT